MWSFNPVTAEQSTMEMGERVCCFAPRQNGGMIIAFADRIVLVDAETGRQEKIHSFEPDNPNTRLNDGRTDRQGRLIVGGMNEGTGACDSSVISVDTDLKVKTVITGISCANSTCFSVDGKTMYFADTPDREILAFDYDTSTGEVSGKRQFASFAAEPGLPDGSCVDTEGGVWNAEWEGHRVVRVAPDGTIDQIVELPVWKPTCCTFGGPNLDTLYVTTSRLWTDEATLVKEPQSGGLFAIKTGFQGVEDAPFRG